MLNKDCLCCKIIRRSTSWTVFPVTACIRELGSNFIQRASWLFWVNFEHIWGEQFFEAVAKLVLCLNSKYKINVDLSSSPITLYKKDPWIYRPNLELPMHLVTITEPTYNFTSHRRQFQNIQLGQNLGTTFGAEWSSEQKEEDKKRVFFFSFQSPFSLSFLAKKRRQWH